MMTFTYSFASAKADPVASITYTIYDGASLHEVMQEFRRFLLAVGYQDSSIETYIEED